MARPCHLVVEQDAEAQSGPRKKVSQRRVVITTDATEDLVLHWGVARDEPGQWLLPPEGTWPAGTTAVSHMSVETPLLPTSGCLPPINSDGGEVDADADEAGPRITRRALVHCVADDVAGTGTRCGE